MKFEKFENLKKMVFENNTSFVELRNIERIFDLLNNDEWDEFHYSFDNDAVMKFIKNFNEYPLDEVDIKNVESIIGQMVDEGIVRC